MEIRKGGRIEKIHFEFSKIIVRRGMLIFLLQVLLTISVMFLRPESSVQLVSLMNATIPLYVVILGGYFGKAGIENYNKIKYNVTECQDNGEQMKTEQSVIDENKQEV